MNPDQAPDRCRIVLIAPPQTAPERIVTALAGGDAASLILPAWGLDDDAFQRRVETIVPQIQAHGVAVMVAGEARIAMRAGADGLHVEAGRPELEEIVSRHQSKLMIGAGGAATRDEALELGEARPDYLFFGRLGYDTKPQPHQKNLRLGRWWAEMVQIPCIVLAGSDLASIEEVAETGAEFVALSAAIFDGEHDPDAALARANAILDERAPRFRG